MQRAARESAETQERVSKAVMDRPGIFQLMAQVHSLLALPPQGRHDS